MMTTLTQLLARRAANSMVYHLTCAMLLCGTIFHDAVAQVDTAIAKAANPSSKSISAKPDFSGVWKPDRSGKYKEDKGFYPKNLGDLSFMMPWAEKEVRRHFNSLQAGTQLPTNILKCLPVGVPFMIQEAHALQIVQTPQQIIFLGESDYQIRFVHLNAKHPSNLSPSWFGHSTGRWEGDTMIVDTVGFNDKTQIDPWGTPHTEAMHVSERVRLLEDGKILEFIITVEDRLALQRPWTFSLHYVKADEKHIAEYSCAENNRNEVSR